MKLKSACTTTPTPRETCNKMGAFLYLENYN